MKKALFTLAGALLVTANLSAQITLNQSSYNTNNIGVDTLLQTTSGSTYPNLAAAASASWDMTVVTDTSAVFVLARVATSGSAQFADSVHQAFGPVVYNLNVQSSVTSTGIVDYGANILRQATSISALTGTSTDSIIIDSQNIVYSSPDVQIAFPATFNSSWTSTYQYDFNFQLSLTYPPVFSYDHAPGIVRAFITEKDSVVGYGQMRVKDINGNPSGYMPVLQIQSTVTTADSFFVNGAPATGTLVALFGLSQGASTSSYSQYYYRPMELTPLANVSYNDNTYSQPSAAQTHAQRLTPEAVTILANNTTINVYPNPVTNHTIYVDISGAQTGSWTYDLINVTGQTVATAAISSNHTQVALSSTLASGIYYLRVNQAGKSICIKPLEIN